VNCTPSRLFWGSDLTAVYYCFSMAAINLENYQDKNNEGRAKVGLFAK